MVINRDNLGERNKEEKKNKRVISRQENGGNLSASQVSLEVL